MDRRLFSRGAFLIATLGIGACSGEIGAGGAPGKQGAQTPDKGNDMTPGKVDDPGMTPVAPSKDPPPVGSDPMAMNVPGAAPLRRLSIREYNNTVRDLLGLAALPGVDFATDDDAGGFSIGGPITTSTDAERFLDAADQVAALAKIETLLPCGSAMPTDAAGQEACAHQFIDRFGLRAFRRPLAADEAAALFKVYSDHRATEIGYGFPEAIKAVVSAALTSPYFLYRAELGNDAPIRDGGLVRFNSFEMASRLSYTLWGTMPDESLFQDAGAGTLTSIEQIEKQARRMLADPRARDAIADFTRQWIDVDGLPKEPPKDARFADYSPALVTSMMNETTAFVIDVMGPKGDGSLDRLLTSTSTTIDGPLAKLYGVTGMSGATAQPASLNPAQRAGLLTQASFLAMHATATDSHPVRRGATVLRRLFCTEIEPPVNMDVGQPKPPADGVTTRERFAVHAMQQCATCHRATDPIGFAFENYDATGAWRVTDQNKTVDASGSITLGKDDVKFTNAVDLMKALAGSEEVRSCVTTQWLRYFVRRGEVAGDEASLQSANAAFKKSSYDLRELLVALTRTPAFTHRSPSLGEMLP